MYLESLPLQAYQTLNFAIFVKNTNGSYIWANHFFINKSAGLGALSDIHNKQDHHFSWHHYADALKANDNMLLKAVKT